MKKVYWILNQYVNDIENELSYFKFLNIVQAKLQEDEINLVFICFDTIQHSYLNQSILYEKCEIQKFDLNLEIEKIEHEYGFTFRQASYSDLLQANKNNSTFEHLDDTQTKIDLFSKFKFLSNTLRGEVITFADISPNTEIEFAKYISLKRAIPFIRTADGSIFGNTPFMLHKKNNVEEVLNIGNKDINFSETKDFINSYLGKMREPYDPYMNSLSQKTSFKLNNIKKNPFSILPKLKRKVFLYVDSKRKSSLYSPIPSEKFFFHGFHLLDESTITLRAQPYSNQLVLVEMISRVLPSGFVLCVREHPYWPERFTFKFLKKIKNLDNVIILSPNISIHKILTNCTGTIVYNNTTGLESLAYGKPVLSFSESAYSNFHGVIRVNNLYNLPLKLIELSNSRIHQEMFLQDLQNLFNNSFKGTLNSYYIKQENLFQISNEFSDKFRNMILTLIRNEKRL